MEHTAVEWTEWLTHRIFFWETDDKKKGKILRAFHHFAMYGLLTLIIVSHVIYPAFWLQTVLLAFCILVWSHHVLTHGCVVSKVEQKLIGDTSSFIDPYMELFGIELPEPSKPGIVTLGSTLVVGTLTLEWISRVSHKVIPLLRGLSPASTQALNILEV